MWLDSFHYISLHCRCRPAEARPVFENRTLRKFERCRVSILLILLEHPKTLLTSTTLEDGASLTTTKYCKGWTARRAYQGQEAVTGWWGKHPRIKKEEERSRRWWGEINPLIYSHSRSPAISITLNCSHGRGSKGGNNANSPPRYPTQLNPSRPETIL